MIQLYYAPPSIYGRKALTVLMEKDLDFQIKPLSFEKGDYKEADYLELNPNGEIPTLVDDDRVIYESTAIGEYLDEEYPEPPLMPTDSYERARVRMIDDFCDLHLYRSIIKCIVKKVFKKEEISEEEKTAVASNLKRIEAYLGKQKFLVGNFTLADCAFMPVIPSLELLGLESLLKTPILSPYVERLKARPSFKGASLLTADSMKELVNS